MSNSFAVGAGLVPLWVTGAASARSGHMMDGGMGGVAGWIGGYGGYWLPVLLVVVVGLMAWIVMHKRK